MPTDEATCVEASRTIEEQHHRTAARQLQVIYTDIAQRVQAITEERPLWPCHKGCDGCCRRLAQPPEMTEAEWHVLHQGFVQLSPATQQEVAGRIRALAHWQGEPVTCPFLDQTHGTCMVYAHRPAACRTYGFYVSRTDHWWCADIQALYEAGVCDGVILGNHSAIARALHQQCGEVRSLQRNQDTMKFGVLQFFSWPERRVPLPTVYERAMQRIAIMDQTGYDAVWLAEHHFTTYSVCPSVHMMGLHVAGRTQHLRIGTGISLAAFYHPLRLAEEVALLDVLSGGRVNWGAGRGFDPTEFKAFGVPLEESARRFREAVAIVLAAWQHERLTWDGRYWHFEDVEVLPKPLQQPHPPTWVAAGSPDAVGWAGAQGYSIMLGPHTHYTDIARQHEMYRKELEAHGHTLAGRDIPITRLIAVAETEPAAADIARQGARWLVDAYVNATKAPHALPQITARYDQRGIPFDPVAHYLDGVMVYGTPERVCDELQRLREEMFLDYLLCAPLSHSSFLLFTEKVLPRLL